MHFPSHQSVRTEQCARPIAQHVLRIYDAIHDDPWRRRPDLDSEEPRVPPLAPRRPVPRPRRRHRRFRLPAHHAPGHRITRSDGPRRPRAGDRHPGQPRPRRAARRPLREASSPPARRGDRDARAGRADHRPRAPRGRPSRPRRARLRRPAARRTAGQCLECHAQADRPARSARARLLRQRRTGGRGRDGRRPSRRSPAGTVDPLPAARAAARQRGLAPRDALDARTLPSARGGWPLPLA